MQTELPVEEVSGPAAILFLAVIQGVAEFLPISSSGHLVLARVAMEVSEAGLALDVALHLGTLAAVVWAFRSDVRVLVRDLFRGRWRMHLWLALATLPIAVIGLTFKNWMEEMFQHPMAAGTGLLFTAVALLAGEAVRSRRESEGSGAVEEGAPTWGQAMWIGLAQALALFPGISRSGVTIAVALLCGIQSGQAARLSFLMSILAVSGAAVVEIPDALDEGFGGLSNTLVVAAAVLAAIVGWVALRILLVTLGRGAFRWFALYCAAVGGLVVFFV